MRDKNLPDLLREDANLKGQYPIRVLALCSGQGYFQVSRRDGFSFGFASQF